ncbi:MAG: NAD-dependent epimerase/dehydratase family protein [Lachnospiraceae bacterium]|nr:NAD-dependent epimerase/dehydratase family protein [Lachnospiraceae bacterium]
MELEGGKDKVLQEDLDNLAKGGFPWKEFRNATFLITGATGLVGSMLVRALLCANRTNELDMRILAMVRSTEKAKNVFGELTQRSELEFVNKDLLSGRLDIPNDVDYIVHTASVTASKMMVTQPVETIETAVFGTKAILDLAKEKKSKGVVYVSSMEVYGSPDAAHHEMKEDDLGFVDLFNVRSCYPEGKRICECMCTAYASEYEVPVVTARLAQTFGAGVPVTENRVFAQFAKSALNGNDIVMHTTGESEGNYCYTADVVNGILLLLLKGEKGQAYNVSNEAAHSTIRDMAAMVADKLADGRIQVVYDIPESNTYGYAPPVKMHLNSSKLQALGWKPRYDLEGMYRRMIESRREDWTTGK